MTILVVDDDPDSRILMRELLRRDGHGNVVCLPHAHAALNALAGVEAVLMNVRMPGMDGIEACGRIRAAEGGTNLPVLMVSTQRDPETIRAAYAAGATDYLYKPIDRSALIVRLRSALALRAELSRRAERERELVRVGAELERSLAAMREDLEAAARLQRSFLPPADLRLRGVRAARHFAPCAQIGGDMLDVLPLGERYVAFYLLDVAGHGVPAALQAVVVRHLLSGAAHITGAGGAPREPGEVLNRLNAELARSSDGSSYCTMAYGLLDMDELVLQYAQAGHPGIAVGSPDGRCRFLPEGDMPVGMFGTTRYHTHRVQLAPKTRLVAYSDGVIETAGANGELFGEQRLAAALAAGAGLELPALLAQIAGAAQAWRGAAPAQDDLSMLALELQ